MKARPLLVEITKRLKDARFGILKFVEKQQTLPINQSNVKLGFQKLAYSLRILRSEKFRNRPVLLKIHLKIIGKSLCKLPHKKSLSNLTSTSQD